jgi:hypothetical protein
MPALLASIVACLAGYLVQDTLSPYVGTATSMLFSILATFYAYYFTRRWLTNLRDR